MSPPEICHNQYASKVMESDVGGEVVCIFNISQILSLPVTSKNVQQATKSDPILSKVLRYTRDGWPTQVPDELKNYYSEISIEADCLLWGIRIIVPKSLQAQVLKTLHEGHLGTRQKLYVVERNGSRYRKSI